MSNPLRRVFQKLTSGFSGIARGMDDILDAMGRMTFLPDSNYDPESVRQRLREAQERYKLHSPRGGFAQDGQRLRGDMERVMGDMDRVLEREGVLPPATKKQPMSKPHPVKQARKPSR